MSSASFQRCGKKLGVFVGESWIETSLHLWKVIESGNSKSLKIIPKSNLKTKKTHQTKKTLTLEMWHWSERITDHFVKNHFVWNVTLSTTCPPAPTPGRVGNQRTAHPNEGGGNGNGASLTKASRNCFFNLARWASEFCRRQLFAVVLAGGFCWLFSSWWFFTNPLEKICSSNWKSFPQVVGVKIKNVWVVTT